MIESMTGFGRAEQSSDTFHARVELRSVNNRYCEVSIKLPAYLQPTEQMLKDRLQKHLKRGKISVSIDLQRLQNAPVDMSINEDELRQKLAVLQAVKERAGIQGAVTLDHLLAFRDLFEPVQVRQEISDNEMNLLLAALDQAAGEMLAMRRQEGAHLLSDLQQRIDALRSLCAEIGRLEKERVPAARDRLNERIAQLLADRSKIDSDRLEQEIALQADRLDISEELVRMQAHIAYFEEMLQHETSQGKKLNFILQEMHREVNTIGSKANHGEISRYVVEMKELVENMREQIQNIV